MLHLHNWTIPNASAETVAIDPMNGFAGLTKVVIGGLPIAVVDRSAAAKLMIETALARRHTTQGPLLVTSADGRVIAKCAGDVALRARLLAADLIHADGMSLVFASRLTGRPLPERISSQDLFHAAAKMASEREARFCLIGGSAPDSLAALETIRRHHPNLLIVGCHDASFGLEEESSLVAAVNASAPDVLWISMEYARGHSFVHRNRSSLSKVGVIKTGGDFV